MADIARRDLLAVGAGAVLGTPAVGGARGRAADD
jgi:hypothetical protein